MVKECLVGMILFRFYSTKYGMAYLLCPYNDTHGLIHFTLRRGWIHNLETTNKSDL